MTLPRLHGWLRNHVHAGSTNQIQWAICSQFPPTIPGASGFCRQSCLTSFPLCTLSHLCTWFKDANFQPPLLHPCRHFSPLSGGGGRESEGKVANARALAKLSAHPSEEKPRAGEEDARAAAGRRGDNARSPQRAWSRRPLKLSV